jgi:hypothetical protein
VGKEPGDVVAWEKTHAWPEERFNRSVDHTAPDFRQGCDEFGFVLPHDPPQLDGLKSGCRPCIATKGPIVGLARVSSHRRELAVMGDRSVGEQEQMISIGLKASELTELGD